MTQLVSEVDLPAAPRFAEKVGLLAGGGRFPAYFAEAARRRNIEIVCVGMWGHADPELREQVDRFHWTGVATLDRTIGCFRREGVRWVVMAGKVRKSEMFDPWRVVRTLPDLRGIRVWTSYRHRRDNRDDSLTHALIEEFRRDGLDVASALEICPELLVRPGVLTDRSPTQKEWRDIVFGWRLAKEMGRLDIGQTVAVKESAPLSIEAVEGTDEAIRRAGRLCRLGAFTVVKVAKPRQDMRFDVPTVGVGTLGNLRESGGRVLAVEAERTILLDEEETLRRANRWGISIVALTEEEVEQRSAA